MADAAHGMAWSALAGLGWGRGAFVQGRGMKRLGICPPICKPTRQWTALPRHRGGRMAKRHRMYWNVKCT